MRIHIGESKGKQWKKIFINDSKIKIKEQRRGGVVEIALNLSREETGRGRESISVEHLLHAKCFTCENSF